MNFTLSPEDEAVRAHVARVAEARLRLLADSWGERDELNRELARAMGEEGLFDFLFPAEYGGRLTEGFRAMTLCLVRAELARTCVAAEELFAVQGLGGYPILLAGNEAQKRRYLPPLSRGEHVPTFALSEPEAGSDPAALRTVARRERDHYVLTGTKCFISNAPDAQINVVFASTEPEAGRHGISALIVEHGTPGLHGRRMHTMAPHVIGELTFEECRVPRANLLGEEGDGWRIAMDTLELFRASVGAQAVGLAQAALDLSIEYARERRQFGQPISSYQAIQFKLADMATELQAARLLVYSAAWQWDQGAKGTALASSMAKLYATEMAGRVIDQAVQIHGGVGVLRGHPVERLYREARAPRIYEGTSEIQRLIIARELLKNP